jgi:hypothetical protein
MFSKKKEQLSPKPIPERDIFADYANFFSVIEEYNHNNLPDNKLSSVENSPRNETKQESLQFNMDLLDTAQKKTVVLGEVVVEGMP